MCKGKVAVERDAATDICILIFFLERKRFSILKNSNIFYIIRIFPFGRYHKKVIGRYLPVFMNIQGMICAKLTGLSCT